MRVDHCRTDHPDGHPVNQRGNDTEARILEHEEQVSITQSTRLPDAGVGGLQRKASPRLVCPYTLFLELGDVFVVRWRRSFRRHPP